MRKRGFAALLLALTLLLCGAAAPGRETVPGAESVPMKIDALLCARAFRRDGQVFVPLRALCAACSRELSWSEDEDGFEAQIGPLTVRGEGLHIDRIDLNAGQLEVRGKVSDLSYEEPAHEGGFWSRLFG